CVPQRVLEAKRQHAEDAVAITQWFEQLQKTIEDYGIQPSDIWNMDETGFQIGVGKDQLVVTRRSRATYLGIPTNRESATAVEAISAAGGYIPAFLILTGKVHMSRWYHLAELVCDTVIGVSDTGYTNDELSYAWLKHFDKWSKKQHTGKYRLLLLDGY